ncbi:MAG: hypothetical protein CL579_07660 [Alteromonadaceae bacterium]|nr:hypothetical protein [Alteromonadaceae bacterium]
MLEEGVGYAQSETVGQRMMVMRTNDVQRIHDVLADARKAGQKCFPTEPVCFDLYGMTKGKRDILTRRTGV